MMKTVDPTGYERFEVSWFMPEPDRLKAASAVLAGSEVALDQSVAAKIGSLSIATARHQDQSAPWLQIRSGPLPEFGGVEFRFDLPAGEPFNPGGLIDELVEAASVFVASPDAVITAAEDAKAIASRVIGCLSGAFSNAELVSIGVRPRPRALVPPAIVVELQTLGHGLTPVVERVQADTLAKLAGKLNALAERHAGRARLRATLLANGSAGWIDETTRRMLSAAGKDPAFAIERLHESGPMEFWMAGSPGSVHGKVYWREGVLKVDYGQCDVLFERDVLHFFRLISPKILRARIGRPVGKLIRSDFIPEEAIVFDATRDHSDTYLTLAIPKTLLPAKPSRGTGHF